MARIRKIRISRREIPISLAKFDELPDSALIDVRVYSGLLGCSPNTVWRRVKSGILPAPIRVSTQQTRWVVRAVRSSLASLTSSANHA